MEELNKTLQMILEKMVTKDDMQGFATKDDLKNFATKDDLKNFATKDDLKNFATKDDLKNFATKDDLKNFATKDDLKNFVTKDYFEEFRMDILDQLFVFEKEFGDKISSIYDYVSLQNDKYEKISKDNYELESRVTRVEANCFGLDRRISVLEMNKK